MKKLLLGLLVCLSLSACDNPDKNTTDDKNETSVNLVDNQIYFFTKDGCPFCTTAYDYVTKNYPNLKMNVIKLKSRQDFELLLQCADKFNLDKTRLGTPMICMGNNYILGWTPESEKQFNIYVKPFIN